MNKGKGLEIYLKKEGYREIDKGIYYHNLPYQLIKVYLDQEGLSYINLVYEDDRGQFIHFLRNRFLEYGEVKPNGKIHTFLSAVQFALEMEKTIGAKTLNTTSKTNNKRISKGKIKKKVI